MKDDSGAIIWMPPKGIAHAYMGLNYDVITWMLPEVVSDTAITGNPDAAVGLYVLCETNMFSCRLQDRICPSSYYI